MDRIVRLLVLSWTLLLLLASACNGQRVPGGGLDYARQPIKIMAPAAPGGGWDQTARALQAALSASLGQKAQVYNVAGAGGVVGLAQFVSDHTGDPQQLMVGGLVMVGATAASAQAPVTLEQVTPIAALTAEWEAIVVPAQSPYKTFGQLLAACKAHPGSVAWGGGSAGGVDHILVALVARAAGIAPAQINYVAHSGGGEALAALLSGAVTAGVAGVSELREQVQAGKLRWLAVSSEQPIAGVDAPPLKDAGLDVVLPNWRAVFAPPGLTLDERAALVATIKQMRTTPEWQQALLKYGWSDFFQTDVAFANFLRAEQERIKGILREMHWTPGGNTPLGARFFPFVIATGLLVLSLVFVLRATIFPDRELAAQVAAEAAATHWPTIGWLVAALLSYACALGWLGYIVATALFFPCVARILGSRRLVRDSLIGLLFSLVIYFSFTRLLGIRLPAGWLAFIS